MNLVQGVYPVQHSIRQTYERVRRMINEPPPYRRPDLPVPEMHGPTECIVQYVDMHGSTRLALETEPVLYASLVMAFCVETADIIRQFGGYPIKYVGDAVMSLFRGYSLYAADSALSSAISIQRMVYNALGPAANRKVEAHISITHGSVVPIQHDNTLDILGAPVNTAAKLLGLHRSVMVDGGVHARLHPRFCDTITPVLDQDWQYGGTIYEYTGGFHD